MPKYLIAACLFTCFYAQAEDKPTQWTIYSSVDLFAFSEPVSIDQFATDFKDNLESGDTAFTHNLIEVGGKWRNLRVAYVQRFDYLTRFTDDTAFFHHASKNNIAIPENRDYNLLLDVERVTATGFKIGYEWNFYKGMTVDVAYSHYTDLRSLQSGYANTLGDAEPFTDQLKADAQVVLDGISAGNRDLSPLLTLIQDISANVRIDYAYDDPKFNEDKYRKPVVTGPKNPVITGVNFGEPDGTGYSVDINFEWQINEQWFVGLNLIDVANQFSWNDAPRTRVNFDLNPFLVDLIGVAQDFVNGEIVRPNDIVDRHLFVEIFNEDYDQELPMRANLSVEYDLNKEVNVFGWTPAIAVIGGYYHTDTKDFPRIGISLDRVYKIQYDIGSEALSLGYEGKYGYLRVVSDDFGYKNARTFGVAAGLTYSF